MKFFQSVSLEEIDNVIENSLHKNDAYGVDNMNYKHFIENREGISKKIFQGIRKKNYQFKPYRELLLLKNRYEPPRCISIPTLTDKVCLKLIQDYLKKVYSNNIVKQKIPQTHIEELKKSLNKYSHYIKVDIEKFFNNINQEKLEEKLRDKLCDEDVDLIMKAVKNRTGAESLHKGVPQGVSISNILTDIYMMDMDKKFIEDPDIFYSRYVDDILILCNKNDCEKKFKEVEKMLESDLDLTLHTGKTKYDILSNSFDYLGYKVYLDSRDGKYKVAIKDVAIKKMEDRLINIIQQYKYSHKGTIPTATFIHRMNLLITGAVTNQLNNEVLEREKRYGWLYFYSQTDSIQCLYHLDSLIERKINKITSKLAESKQNQINKSLKKFVVTYFEIKYNYSNSTYLFRPDRLKLEDKQEFLINTFGYGKNVIYFEYNKENYSSEEEFNEYIDKLYYKNVYMQIKKQEQDVLDMIS
ncbi:TPA: hypothetical protein I0F57_RS04335 [Enterococcus faecalis]|uniref:reverse transcriptase domain-containing protein n=1 Tax=Enterococcus TaxID=1350 RepID=UPI00094B59DE|nr:reverse transcriptase domain-containing protein [Enterococcus faecalis]EGO2748144.1 hypothetical protein [Enterococcus faecalis]EGO8835596.1 hypothetical protein [Enterococcus faecalis]EHQ8831203.1 hypothetical protein [Enterococcus faecalis]HBI1544721.1 hypothetical protein [Enterococcus faecalis]HBI1637073.1 hypothetical protein [Enterococcus faecalis]